MAQQAPLLNKWNAGAAGALAGNLVRQQTESFDLMKTVMTLLATMALATISVTYTVAAQDRPETREDVEEIVRDYLLENPEIIAEAIMELQMRRESAAAMPDCRALQGLAGEGPLSHGHG